MSNTPVYLDAGEPERALLSLWKESYQAGGVPGIPEVGEMASSVEQLLGMFKVKVAKS